MLVHASATPGQSFYIQFPRAPAGANHCYGRLSSEPNAATANTMSEYLPIPTSTHLLYVCSQSSTNNSQIIHVWYIYIHLGHLWGKCR